MEIQPLQEDYDLTDVSDLTHDLRTCFERHTDGSVNLT